MKDIGLGSEKTLMERYREGQKKFPQNFTQWSSKKKVDPVKKMAINPLMGLGD
jgi:hypothetical protein